MARTFRTIRRQRPVRGGRDPLPACVLHAIRARVEQDARHHGVSKSWVIATILGAHYRVEGQESYKVASLNKS